MYLVNSVKLNRKKSYTIEIKTDNTQDSFDISEDIMVEFRLVKGKALSKQEYKKFVEANNKDIIFQKVLYYALYKMRTVHEIKEYLIKKSIPKSEHKYYIDKLKQARIIDDIKFAELYIRESFEYKRIGPKKIQFDLEKKGIYDYTYKRFIEKLKPEDINNNIEYLLKKKLDSIKDKSFNKTIQTLKQFLVRKGYNIVSINLAVDRNNVLITSYINEDKSLLKDYEIASKKYRNKEDKQKKILTFLMRKGYHYSKIKAVLGEKLYG